MLPTASKATDPGSVSDPMRSAVRFPLEIRAVVETEHGPVNAMTVDISASGILLKMPFSPGVDAPLAWTLSLPGEVMGSTRDVLVRCVGRVVWQSGGEGALVGAVIDDYRMGEAA